jgi:lipopolysaccharide transport system permease protein
MDAMMAGRGSALTATDQTRVPVVTIKPSNGWVSLRLQELWEHRELIYFLIWRDIKVRYKQTVLGAAWAIIQPLFTMAVFAVFFGHLAKIPSDGVPYPMFAYAALVPWTFFANALTQASNSLVGSAGLITKVYFPRLVVPLASVLSGIVDLVLAFGVLLLLMVAYGVGVSARLLWVPVFVVLTVTAALAVSLWLSALNVKYRDVRYTVPFLTQVWLFATPVAYPSSLLPEPWRTLYGLNPMVGVVEGFRWAMLNTGSAPGSIFLVSSLASLLFLLLGAHYFRRVEGTFADRV